MNLSTIRAPKGSSEKRKRIGRGMGSGMGKTATRGHKGQGSRSGSRLMRGFEGGQMPLHRRLPKRGFTNIFKKDYAIVNLDRIAALGESSVTLTLQAWCANAAVVKQVECDLLEGAKSGLPCEGIDLPPPCFNVLFKNMPPSA